MNKKKQHQWDFMGNGNNGKGDLHYCNFCNQWKWTIGKPFKMKAEKHAEMLKTGEITGF
jgi:hypothetical protein